ncbi:MAG: hypothetical protein ABWJ97_08430, partial [Thermoproteus sp.]
VDFSHLRPPLVVKGLSDASRPEFFLDIAEATQKALERAPCLVQEYIVGVGRGYFAVAWNGEVLLEFTHERLVEQEPVGGASIGARGPVMDPLLFKIGRKVIERLKWTGPIMVETKWDPYKDEYYLIEINPKFWGSLALPVSLGYHFPAILALAYLEGKERALEIVRGLFVRYGEYFFLADGLYYIARLPKVYSKMLYRSKLISSDIDLTDPIRTLATLSVRLSFFKKYRDSWIRHHEKYMKATPVLLRKKDYKIVLFDLDGTLVRLEIDWKNAHASLVSKGYIKKRDTIIGGLYKLWNKDKEMYNKASELLAEIETDGIKSLKPLVNIKKLNELKKSHNFLYYIVTFQSQNIAQEVVRRLKIEIDNIIGRDSGYGPLKGDMVASFKNNSVLFDDNLYNVVEALRIGIMSVNTNIDEYTRYKSIELGIPAVRPSEIPNLIAQLPS